jgi:hypothetical protein
MLHTPDRSQEGRREEKRNYLILFTHNLISQQDKKGGPRTGEE